MNADNRRLAAIMFTDMVGYSTLTHRDEPLSIELLKEHRAIVRQVVAEYRGREVGTTGDGFVCEFGSTTDAVGCALAIQKKFQSRNSSTRHERRINLRIGIHVGDILGIGNDIYGDGVNIAARLQSVAPTGGICLSQAVHDQVRSTIDFPIKSVGVRKLKGIRHPMHIWVIDLKKPTGREKLQRVWFKLRRHQAWAVATAAAVAAVSWAQFQNSHWLTGHTTDHPRIAVLPFEGEGLNTTDGYIPEGITDELIASLSRESGLRVLAKGSVLRFKRADKSPLQIGKELGVTAFLDGVVRREGDSLKVNVSIVDTQSQENVWSGSFEGKSQEIYNIQKDILAGVSKHYHLRVPASLSDKTTATPSNEAYLAYLRGRHFLSRRTREGILKGIAELESSVKLDSHYASAYAALADAASIESYYGMIAPAEASLQVVKYGNQAVALDPNSTEALMSLAEEKAYSEYDFKVAEETFLRAIASNPAHPTAHQWYGEFLVHQGRFKEALQQNDIAIQLDPLSPVTAVAKGNTLYFQRDYDGAIKQLKSVIELDPGFMLSYYWIGRVYSAKQDYASATIALKKAVELSEREPMMLAALGHAYGMSGNKIEAARILKELQELSKTRYVSPYHLASVAIALGEKQAALDLLQKAVIDRAGLAAYVGVDPELDSIRNESRFNQISQQITLAR
jgi:class 3 adenylate cyclase/TolB-like protein/cytochrome c-type biogenesis protein CcmH/NrfG